MAHACAANIWLWCGVMPRLSLYSPCTMHVHVRCAACWFGPGWRGDTGHIPHFERAGNSQYRGEGGIHEEVSEVWEEWGEGQRGKGSVSGNAPQKRGGLGRGGEERERGGVQAGRGCGAKGTQGRGGGRGGGGNNRGLERGGGTQGSLIL